MSLYDTEFDEAFRKTLEKHPAISADLGRSLLVKLQEFLRNEDTKPAYDRQSYPEVLRRTLNHFHLQGTNRTAYSSLAGAFFGKRGGRKAAATRHHAPKVKKPLPPQADTNLSVGIIFKGNQSGWDF